MNGNGEDTLPLSISAVVTGLETVITGTGVPGATITLTDNNDDALALIDSNGDPLDPSVVTVADDGSFVAIPAAPLQDNTAITATQSNIPHLSGTDDEFLSSQTTQIVQIDTDSDGALDSIDIDDDNDGILDANETFLGNPLEFGSPGLTTAGINFISLPDGASSGGITPTAGDTILHFSQDASTASTATISSGATISASQYRAEIDIGNFDLSLIHI